MPGKNKSRLEKRAMDFGEEISALGRELEFNAKRLAGWHDSFLGPAGPLLISMLSLAALYLLAWAMSLPGLHVLSELAGFVRSSMPLFFLMFLLSSYSSYLSRKFPEKSRLVHPAAVAVGITFSLWVGASVAGIANSVAGVSSLDTLAGLIEANISLIFALVIIIGYMAEAIKSQPVGKPRKPGASKSAIKRLYRSGNDKVLGGVCGGIGEYMRIDSVIVRLLWIAFALMYGAGLLAYLIAWIVIPRNPGHSWS